MTTAIPNGAGECRRADRPERPHSLTRVIAAAAAAAIASGGPAGAASVPWTPADTRRLVEQLFATFNRHDAAAMANLYAADVHATSTGYCGERVGREAVRRGYQAIFDQAPGVTDEVEDILVQGDAVAVRFVGRAPGDGGMRDVQHVAAFLRIRDGLVASVRTIQDSKPPPCGS
jgi:uncharacterized protein (TIGR02246 family)